MAEVETSKANETSQNPTGRMQGLRQLIFVCAPLCEMLFLAKAQSREGRGRQTCKLFLSYLEPVPYHYRWGSPVLGQLLITAIALNTPLPGANSSARELMFGGSASHWKAASWKFFLQIVGLTSP